jgi:phosphoenolpyruvate---glycerone phosphotransferase subunit DhaK
MQRFVNNPDDIVDETVRGFCRAHGDRVRLSTTNKRVVVAKDSPNKGRVGIVTGGGSGHEPAFIGYTGKNMLDAVAIGELFSSPTAKSFYDAICEADGGMGVAVLYGNYAGDNMNVKMAKKMAKKQNIAVETVVANDDVCSASIEEKEKRRGVAGEIFMWKIGAAKAAEGADLLAVKASAQKAIDNCRSVGVGLGPCTLPSVGHPNFIIEAGTMEVGIGHHGEPGIRISELKSANDVADEMSSLIIADQQLAKGTEVAVLVSGLGATPINELYVLYSRIEENLETAGLSVHKSYIGNYFTSLDMVGATLTVLALDDELKGLLDVDVDCPSF